jgi:hypothetical protein
MWTAHACLIGITLVLFAGASLAAGGASGHWAYRPLALPATPPVSNNDRARTPIDAFILGKLEAQQIQPAEKADARTLLRRLHFNLIGLPPTPGQLESFLADPSGDAYERMVDELLASPHYGERWARHWMDAVHFAETHGHDQDRIRTNAWPYRDYLISALNADKPYARFIQEQVAGDALFPDDPQASVALGFLAAGPWDESSLRDIREDTLDRQIGRYLDRDDMLTTVMQTFTSTTVHCARCHDHKFDPISLRDYYSLQAVFAGVDRANRIYDADPAVHARRQELLRNKRRIEKGNRELLLNEASRLKVAEWERRRAASEVNWKIMSPQVFTSSGGATLSLQADGSILSAGARPERDTYIIETASPLPAIAAVRLEVLTDENLPHRGPGRQDNGNLHLSEFELWMIEPGAETAVQIPLAHATADFNQAGWTIAHALDGNEKTAWGIYPKVGEAHEAVFELKKPMAISGALRFVLKQLHGGGHLIGRFRLSVMDAESFAGHGIMPPEIEKILTAPADQRTEPQRAALAIFVLSAEIERALARLPAPSLIYAAAAEFEPDGGLRPAGGPRPVHVLHRGEITRPRELAEPGALPFVAMLPARFPPEEMHDESARRAALAKWLAHRDNPLTWRSIVNRVWHHHFGRGLVDTPNDFGKLGSEPSHPELLDWLAVWFRDEAQGSLKQLHRLIVMSAVYRQSSAHPSASPAAQADSENRLLWRMNRARLDAEQVRDAMLQISGRLDPRMGGPSDMQFHLQPGIHVTPVVDYTKFDPDSEAGRRRGIYRFLFRTLPDPFMDALDCPAGDQLTPVRNASVTVQQALALWNNEFVLRQAGHLAARLENEAQGAEAQIRQAFVLVLGRAPTTEEAREFGDYIRKHGLANFARVLFNSNEFLFVN